MAIARLGPPRDREAHRAIYLRYAPVVHGILLSRVPRADADDLTHDVFLAAIPKLGQLRDPRTLGAWLAQIARRQAADRRRPTSPSVTRLGGSEPGRAPDPPARPDSDQIDRVLTTIRSLPETYAESLTLRLVYGLTGPQIAERLGMTHGSVRVNLTRGMALLREKLGPQFVTEAAP